MLSDDHSNVIYNSNMHYPIFNLILYFPINKVLMFSVWTINFIIATMSYWNTLWAENHPKSYCKSDTKYLLWNYYENKRETENKKKRKIVANSRQTMSKFHSGTNITTISSLHFYPYSLSTLFFLNPLVHSFSSNSSTTGYQYVTTYTRSHM